MMGKSVRDHRTGRTPKAERSYVRTFEQRNERGANRERNRKGRQSVKRTLKAGRWS